MINQQVFERTQQALESAATLCRELQVGRGRYSETDFHLLAIAFEGDAERFTTEKEKLYEQNKTT